MIVGEELTGLIIDAVVDDEALGAVSRGIAQALNATSVLIQTTSKDGQSTLSAHIDSRLLGAYQAHYWRHDLWISDLPLSYSEDVILSDSYVPEDKMLNSEIYNDLLRPAEDIFRCVGFGAALDGGGLLFLGVHHMRRRQFSANDLQTVGELRPALTRLVAARRRLAAGRGRLAERAVDADPDAVMVAQSDGRLVFANKAAFRALESGLLSLQSDRLSAGERTLNARLSAALRSTCAGRGGSVLASADGDLRIAVDPLQSDSSGTPFSAGPPLALVRLRNEAAHRATALAVATTALGLTAAERDLADAIMRGVAPASYARNRGVAVTTVRTQLRSLHAKASVSSRSELLLRLRG